MVDVVHGERREDEYFWLRDKDSPEVTAYLEAENAHTDAVMKGTEAFQDALYKEMLARIKEDDSTVPYRRGRYVYYSRTETGKQYPIHCRRRDEPGAPEEITLDLNRMAEGHAFLSLGLYTVSDDGRLLAYSVDFTGFREYTLHIKDLTTAEVLADRIEKVSSAAWSADNSILFYVTEDEAKRTGSAPRLTICCWRSATSCSGSACFAREAARSSSPPSARSRPASIAGCPRPSPSASGA